MMNHYRVRSVLIAVSIWALGAPLVSLFSGQVPAPDRSKDLATRLAFFERKVRPILIEHCYECHSSKTSSAKGGLRLDNRDDLLTGGDSGPAIVVGKPKESLLLSALRHDDLEMPPSQQLPAEVIADFADWIENGAVMPAASTQNVKRSKPSMLPRSPSAWWSYQPRKQPTIPTTTVSDLATWCRSPIDAFIADGYGRNNVRPIADATRASLLRRLTTDLIGLLPTLEELDAFENDRSPKALEVVVDRLLARPEFGERWGRHWLDLARYADSNGKDENLTFHHAYRYRDWVIDAINADMPYDKFVTAQLAGDLLDARSSDERDRNLIATGFLVVGPKVLADRDTVKRRFDVIDEQLDTIGRALLGQSIGCARCHDHKFDPISAADYYALAGIFASTRTLDGMKLNNPVVSGWLERPLGPNGDSVLAAYRQHQQAINAAVAKVKKAETALKTLQSKAKQRSAMRAGTIVDDSEATKHGLWKVSTHSPGYVGTGYIHDDRAGKGQKSVVYTTAIPLVGRYEVLVSYTPGASRARRVPVVITHANGVSRMLVDQMQNATVDDSFQSLGIFSFTDRQVAAVEISNAGTTGHVIADAVWFAPVKGCFYDDAAADYYLSAELKSQVEEASKTVKAAEANLALLKAKTPQAPSTAMAVRDEDTIADLAIQVRGNHRQLGAVVKRGMPHALASFPGPSISGLGSGRRELAAWMTDPRHPLTARVFVNRVWMHLFGEGLVRTVDDFGHQGELPSHPDLLDFLANQFIAEGWSLKRLVRAIVLSRVYGLATAAKRQGIVALPTDPENRWLARANRRRLDAEVLRDSLLQLGGDMDTTQGGSTVSQLGEAAINNSSQGGLSAETSKRRSVYLPMIRNDVPSLLAAFDMADLDVSTGRRDQTNVPAQSLYLLNAPFIHERSEAIARRLLALMPANPGERMSQVDERRLDSLVRSMFSEHGNNARRREIMRYITAQRATNSARKVMEAVRAEQDLWAGVIHALVASSSFRFLD